MTKLKDNKNLLQVYDRKAFINAMRSVASSVAVVTTNGKKGCHGATVSSFCSVSADPPMVLICLHAESRTAQAVIENAIFCVNLLPHFNQALANRFAGRLDENIENRFDGVDLEIETGYAPIISGCTAFCCNVNESFHSGSHRVFIGRVLKTNGNITEPLIYANGEYHHLGRINTINVKAVS